MAFLFHPQVKQGSYKTGYAGNPAYPDLHPVLPYSTLLPRHWAAIGTARGSAHRRFTSPFMRAAVLAMSGTRRVYHYGPVQVVAMRLAKTHSRQVFVAPMLFRKLPGLFSSSFFPAADDPHGVLSAMLSVPGCTG